MPHLRTMERPLSDRGKRDAPRMGKRLAKRDVRIDLILSSPARRAIKTARILADQLEYQRKDIVIDDRLYPGTANALLEIVRGLGGKWDSIGCWWVIVHLVESRASLCIAYRAYADLCRRQIPVPSHQVAGRG